MPKNQTAAKGGRLIILGGPSTSGKSTIANMLGFPTLVSVTTRKPRPGEIHGVHYYFIPVWKYDLLSCLGRIPEKTVYAGVKYGIYKKTLEAVKKRDTHTVGIFDAKGVKWLRNYLGPERVLAIYVGVNEKTMRRRLEARGSSPEEVERRIRQALQKELRPDYIDVYDEVVWNNDGTPIEETVEKIRAILRKRRLLPAWTA